MVDTVMTDVKIAVHGYAVADAIRPVTGTPSLRGQKLSESVIGGLNGGAKDKAMWQGDIDGGAFVGSAYGRGRRGSDISRTVQFDRAIATGIPNQRQDSATITESKFKWSSRSVN